LVQAAAVAPLLPRPKPGGMLFSIIISTPVSSPLRSSSAQAGGPAEFLFGALGSSLLQGPRALILTTLVFVVLTCTLSACLLRASPNTSKPAPRLAVEQLASTLTASPGIIDRGSWPRLSSSLDNNWSRTHTSISATRKRARIAHNQPRSRIWDELPRLPRIVRESL